MVANRKNSDQNPKNSQTQNFQNRKSKISKSKIENFQNPEEFFSQDFFFDDKKNFLRFFFDDEKKSWDFFLEIFFLRF